MKFNTLTIAAMALASTLYTGASAAEETTAAAHYKVAMTEMVNCIFWADWDCPRAKAAAAAGEALGGEFGEAHIEEKMVELKAKVDPDGKRAAEAKTFIDGNAGGIIEIERVE